MSATSDLLDAVDAYNAAAVGVARATERIEQAAADPVRGADQALGADLLAEFERACETAEARKATFDRLTSREARQAIAAELAPVDLDRRGEYRAADPRLAQLERDERARRAVLATGLSSFGHPLC